RVNYFFPHKKERGWSDIDFVQIGLATLREINSDGNVAIAIDEPLSSKVIREVIGEHTSFSPLRESLRAAGFSGTAKGITLKTWQFAHCCKSFRKQTS